MNAAVASANKLRLSGNLKSYLLTCVANRARNKNRVYQSRRTVGLEDADKWQVKTRQGLRFFLYRGFTMTLQYNYDYNNQPSAEAEKKWDSTLLFLLGFQFQN